MEERIEKAVALFMEGYNCSQSVVAAFADLYGFDKETALRFSASFGAGIGRLRHTCGAACGMFMLAGLEKAALEGSDSASKSANYAIVQQLAERFKAQNGSLICAELLQLRKNTPITPTAEERNAEYYKQRPCALMVERAARIFADFYRERHPER